MIGNKVKAGIVAMLKSGATIRKTAKAFGVNRHTVGCIGRGAGVASRGNRATKQMELNVLLCISYGMSNCAVARRCGCSRSVVDRLKSNRTKPERDLRSLHPTKYKLAVDLLKRGIQQSVVATAVGLGRSVISRIRVRENIPSNYKSRKGNDEAVLPASQMRPSGQQDPAICVQRSS